MNSCIIFYNLDLKTHFSKQIAETVSWKTSDLDFKERGAFSRLEISILEAEHYKMGLTYTSSSLGRAYQDTYYGSYEKQPEKEDKEVLRYYFY